MLICRTSRMFHFGYIAAILLSEASIGAASEPAEELAVVGVYSEGKLDQRATVDLARLIRQNGDAARLAKPRALVPWNCSDRACLHKVANELHSQRLIQVAIQLTDRESQSYLLSLRLFDAATAQVEEREIHCDACDPRARIERAATEISEGFLRRVSTPASEPRAKAEVLPSSDELSSQVLNPISDSGPSENPARPALEQPSQEIPGQRALTVPTPTPVGPISNTTAPIKVLTPLPLELNPTAAVSSGRLRAAWVFGGMSIAFTGIAGYVTAGSFYGERFCPVRNKVPVEQGPCDAIVLGSTWGLAVTSATTSLIIRFVGVGK